MKSTHLLHRVGRVTHETIILVIFNFVDRLKTVQCNAFKRNEPRRHRLKQQELWFRRRTYRFYQNNGVPEEHAGRQQVRAARQVVLHVQVVVTELGPDQFGRGEYAHAARFRGARVPRRPPDQLFARVEIGRAVGRALAQPAAHRLRVARHVRAVPADAQVPRTPRTLFAVPSAEAQPGNRHVNSDGSRDDVHGLGWGGGGPRRSGDVRQ